MGRNINIILYTIAAICVTIKFNKSNEKIFIFLSLILGLMWYNLNIDPLFLLLSGLGGAIVEMIIIYFTTDIWKYRSPDIINIPIWLPLLWSIASVFILSLKDISQIITEIINE